VNIQLPELKDRPEDIPLLAHAFLAELAAENGRPAPDITPAALARLQSHDWPGNVRQLRNVLESVIVTATREVIDEPDLPEPVREARASAPQAHLIKPGMNLEQIEKEAIRVTLHRCGGNRTAAAAELGISVRTLRRKINEYEL